MNELRSIRRWTLLFMAGLLVSGLTAVPLVSLSHLLVDLARPFGGVLSAWAERVVLAIERVDAIDPLLFYGTDWLAFAHVAIALAFIGPYRDPLRNKWVIEWGLWCCLLVVPVAFLWAPLRGIPFFWRCVDASFGLLGAIPLIAIQRSIKRMERRPANA